MEGELRSLAAHPHPALRATMREKGSLWCFAFGQGAEIVEPAARVWKHVELDEIEHGR